MATHRMSIFGAQVAPDNSGRAFFQPYDVLATNDLFRHLVLTLTDPGASEVGGIYGAFTVPKSYVSAPKLIVVWTSAGTSGNVKLDFDYRAVGGDDAESLDQATFQEQLTVTDAAPTAAHSRMESSMALTAGNLAADDLVEFFFSREDGGGTDTLAASIAVHDIMFEWSDA